MYNVLYQANIGVDFVFPESPSLSEYKVILVPPLYVASDSVLNRLAEYVKNGGHLVLAFKSGFTNEYSTVRWDTMPGPLREAAGFHYQEFSNLKARFRSREIRFMRVTTTWFPIGRNADLPTRQKHSPITTIRFLESTQPSRRMPSAKARSRMKERC